MLFLPLHKAIKWKNLPWLTFLLILINIVAFINSQQQNNITITKALDYYWNSPLSTIELPIYLDALHQRGDTNKLDKLKQLLTNSAPVTTNKILLNEFILAMNYDQAFIAPLRANKIITPNSTNYQIWHNARSTFDDFFLSTPNNQYGFIPASPHLKNLLTGLLIHSEIQSLVVNMIFLFLIGFALEKLLGIPLYLLLYIVTGITATTVFWAVDQNIITPITGTSGVIAGLMGLYVGLFKSRKIRPFYFLLVCFDYMRISALIMLPLWLGNELWRVYSGFNNQTALLADIVSLIVGVLIATLIVKNFSALIKIEYLDSDEKIKNKELRTQQALNAMNELNLEKALSLLRDLHRDFPDDREILKSYYKTTRYFPNSPESLNLLKKILTACDHTNCSARLMREAYTDFYKNPDAINLTSAQLMRLSILFCHIGYLNDAESIIGLLLKNEHAKLNGLDNVMYVLATTWHKKGDLIKSQNYQDRICKLFPGSVAAELIKKSPIDTTNVPSNFAKN